MTRTGPDDCGCCAGREAATPVPHDNPPGLSAFAYRVGTHGRFKASMLAALARQPALRPLTTRADDDPAIALLDAAAVVLDVLAFYQERIANEGFLRTAAERRSLLELARSIGYELAPGVAAGTYLSFELETAPGAPGAPAVPAATTIAAGTRVQSVPGPDEKPQTFETVETIGARPAWNAIAPQLTAPQALSATMQTLWLEGTASGLIAGDRLLIAGAAAGGSVSWAVRRVAEVRPDAGAKRTRLELEAPPSTPKTTPAIEPGVWALRVRAALFGHNAPKKPRFTDGKFSGDYDEWALADTDKVTTRLTLDAVYDAVVAPSLLVVEQPATSGGGRDSTLRRVGAAAVRSRADYGVAGRVKELTFVLPWTETAPTQLSTLREVVVYAASEALASAAAPLTAPAEGAPSEHVPLADGALIPLEGARLTFAGLLEGLQAGQALVVTGKRMRVRAKQALPLVSASGPVRSIAAGETLVLLASPATDAVSGQMSWLVEDAEGVEGVIVTHPAKGLPLELIPAAEDDPAVSEIAVLDDAPSHEGKARTVVVLDAPLIRSYDRATATIGANVARAGHGESKREVLGSGDGSKPFQSFALKQRPLTYRSAATASGSETTLEVRVNDVLWQEVESLYGRPAGEQSYATRRADDGTVSVQFGDGLAGARLPSGSENVVASYRVGTGLAGQVAAGRLGTLLTRPLGVKGVTNPIAASGAEDPETRDQARQNAPLTVLTLDRIVSLRDYRDFARAFAGVGKARSEQLWRGETRLVHLSVAAADGGRVEAGSDLFVNLQQAIAERSDAHQPFALQSFEPLAFGLEARVLVDAPRHLPEEVFPVVRAALLAAFSFEARDFAQPVTADEVIAVIQGVAGVVAVDLNELRASDGSATPAAMLVARRARLHPGDPRVLLPAQLLTVDPSAIDLLEWS